MSNCHIYKFSQNNLYSYNIIADSLRKNHISENRETITVQRLKYQGVNELYGSKKNGKLCSGWNGVFTQCIDSLKIAIIFYRCINKFRWYGVTVDQQNWALYATVELY
jgi:hypothetical protein